MFKAKFPIVRASEPNGKQSLQSLSGVQALNGSEPTYDLKPNLTGIFAFIFYTLAFVWFYGSTYYYKPKLRNKLITLSDALFLSEKTGGTLFLLIFTALYITLLNDKGFFYKKDDNVQVVIAGNFAILTSIVLLYFISLKYVSHKVLAVLIILFSTLSAYMFSKIYTEEFEENDYTKTFLALFSIEVIFGLLVLMSFTTIQNFTLIAIGEVILLTCYGICLLLLSLMPTLLDLEKICAFY